MSAELLRAVLPRLALSVLFLAGCVFAYFESVYLGDQARMIADSRIEFWMWAFRLVAAASLVMAVGLAATLARFS
ncbi:MAG: hypothetical protein Q8922_01790 [Bacteroidota bacterium]|nr:hypothetical protein [Bacteroidota bacterium]MDP4232041.1 hypothetical protein [Bacteroidota bacterium]MDP4241252.1 hypothetical protein [Bacteroidota bacterium]MDP4286644.1 hypothetical protein [Bacteroidota bacterium]